MRMFFVRTYRLSDDPNMQKDQRTEKEACGESFTGTNAGDELLNYTNVEQESLSE